MLFVYCLTGNIYDRKEPSDQEHRPEEARNFTVKAKEDEGSNKSLFIYLFTFFYILTDSFTSSAKQNPLRSLMSDEAFIAAERKN